ncbi:MAG TPA: hypothetical protein VG034_19780 [Acidimicrobiia bacterium]|nr:hypothetical protein [Acidimicrobiia bacterium]
MSGRARLGVLALGLFFLISASAAPAQASESRGVATQDGWWNRLQGPQEGEPDGNPIRPLVPAVPKPPNVPADAIAAGATAGQVDKVAAVGIDVTLADGATLDGLVLRLKESDGNGANVGADKAKVLACPATGPWGTGQNGAWRDRPVADCSLGSAEGVRAADGTWTFDLAAIGRLWADPFAPLAANGVVLSVDPAVSPSSVQVSWLNYDSGNVAVELAVTPGVPAAPADSSAVASDAVSATPAGAAEPALESPGASRAFPTGSGVSAGSLAYPSGPAAGETTATPDVSATGAPPESPGEATLSAAPAGPGPVLQARPAVDFWEHVPAPTALLLPVALGLALLVSVTLGPAGRPSAVFRREGGLSRALARRSPGGTEAA